MISETVSRKISWPISTWLLVVSLIFGSFALISSELLLMAVLTPMAAYLSVSEGAAGQAVTPYSSISLYRSRMVAVVILSPGSQFDPSGPLRSSCRWRQGTGVALAEAAWAALELLRSSKRNKS
ncbi:hypothetical protein ACQZ5G_17590 [Agrobacterium sp. 22-214-1]